MSTIQERVEAGGRWLDANRPGWVDRIDLTRLNLRNSCGCLLGQEFGHYSDAVDGQFGGDAYAPVWLGFNGRLGSPRDWAADVDDLTTAWRDYITARRAAA